MLSNIRARNKFKTHHAQADSCETGRVHHTYPAQINSLTYMFIYLIVMCLVLGFICGETTSAITHRFFRGFLFTCGENMIEIAY